MSKPLTTSLTLLPLPTPSTHTHVTLLPPPYALLHNADSPSSYILKDESNLDSEGARNCMVSPLCSAKPRGDRTSCMLALVIVSELRCLIRRCCRLCPRLCRFAPQRTQFRTSVGTMDRLMHSSLLTNRPFTITGTLVPPIPTPYILSPPFLLQPHLNSLQIYNIQTLSFSSHTFPFYITSCTSTSSNLLLTSKSYLYIYSLSFQLLKRINLKWGGIISSILALPSNYISVIWDSNNGEGSSHSLINLEEQEGEHEGVEENESFALKLGKMHLQVIKGNWLITTLDGSR